MADTRPIGVFDSGLGGLTVVKELQRLLPGEDIVYFGDTGRVPYGTRSFETITQYARQDEAFLLANGVKLIVAACGTVSAVAAHTGAELPVPFVEVVSPACAAAAAQTKNQKIGVIGTSATVRSGMYTQKLLEHCSSLQVTATACPLFVPLVENGWIDRADTVAIETAKRYLADMQANGADTLILGCTHYPVLKEIIGDIMGPQVTLINTGVYAAQRVQALLQANRLQNNSGHTGQLRCFVTDRAESFSNVATLLLGQDISANVTQVDMSRLG